MGADSSPGLLARQQGLLQLSTDRLPHLLPHPPAKVWVLSGSGLISRVEAWGSRRECWLSRLRLFSPAMGCHAAVPSLGARVSEKGAGWGRLSVQREEPEPPNTPPGEACCPRPGTQKQPLLRLALSPTTGWPCPVLLQFTTFYQGAEGAGTHSASRPVFGETAQQAPSPGAHCSLPPPQAPTPAPGDTIPASHWVPLMHPNTL